MVYVEKTTTNHLENVKNYALQSENTKYLRPAGADFGFVSYTFLIFVDLVLEANNGQTFRRNIVNYQTGENW